MSAREPEDRELPPALRRGALTGDDVPNRWPGSKSRDFVFVEGSSEETYVESMALAVGAQVVEVGVYPIVDWSVVAQPRLVASQGDGGGSSLSVVIPGIGQPIVSNPGHRRPAHGEASEDTDFTISVTVAEVSSNPTGQTRVRVVYFPPAA